MEDTLVSDASTFPVGFTCVMTLYVKQVLLSEKLLKDSRESDGAHVHTERMHTEHM